MAESEEELKSLLMGVKEESENNIQKTNIMASSPITSWQIEGEKVEAVIYFILLGSKITADGDCSYEIKAHLLLTKQQQTSGTVWELFEVTPLVRMELLLESTSEDL